MLSTDQCRELLKDYSSSDEKIIEVRDYLRALAKEVILKNIGFYETNLLKIKKPPSKDAEKSVGKKPQNTYDKQSSDNKEE
ncbi:MAG: hypothetical protein AAB681_02410 [Patescibacteria group bacterium]